MGPWARAPGPGGSRCVFLLFYEGFYNSRAAEAPKCKVSEKTTPDGSRSHEISKPPFSFVGQPSPIPPSESKGGGGDYYGIRSRYACVYGYACIGASAGHFLEVGPYRYTKTNLLHIGVLQGSTRFTYFQTLFT